MNSPVSLPFHHASEEIDAHVPAVSFEEKQAGRLFYGRRYDAAMPSDASLTFRGFQQHIRDRYFATDSARGTPATFMWLVEEVGELATALNTTGDKRDQANIEEEFADVIAWLCTLANINGVDLDAAIHTKYLSGGGPKGHK